MVLFSKFVYFQIVIHCIIIFLQMYDEISYIYFLLIDSVFHWQVVCTESWDPIGLLDMYY